MIALLNMLKIKFLGLQLQDRNSMKLKLSFVSRKGAFTNSVFQFRPEGIERTKSCEPKMKNARHDSKTPTVSTRAVHTVTHSTYAHHHTPQHNLPSTQSQISHSRLRKYKNSKMRIITSSFIWSHTEYPKRLFHTHKNLTRLLEQEKERPPQHKVRVTTVSIVLTTLYCTTSS